MELKNTQKRVAKMIEAREQLSYKERLKILRLFGLQTKRLKGGYD